MNLLLELLEWFYEVSCFVLEPLFFATYAAFFLAAAVLIVNLVFRKWLTATQMGLLWGLVLIRLVIPSLPESSLSFQTLATDYSQQPAPEIRQSQPEDEVFTFTAADGSQVTQTASGVPVSSHPTQNVQPEESLLAELFFAFIELTPLIFGIVAPMIILWTVCSYWSFRRKILLDKPTEETRICSLWKACCERADIKNDLPVYLSDEISHPAVMGIFSTKLLLPIDSVNLEDDQLRMIMFHELAHVRRWDIAVNWFMMILRALHFWNPIYWLASSRFQNLREQACDNRAVHWMGGAEKSREYSELLLKFVDRDSQSNRWKVVLPSSLLGFMTAVRRKFSIANRLKSLKNHRDRRHPLETILAVAVLVSLGYCGLTDAKAPDLDEKNSQDWVKSYANLNVDFSYPSPNFSSEKGEDYVVIYKTNKVIEKLTNDQRGREEVERELYWHFNSIIRSSNQLLDIISNKVGPPPKIDPEKLRLHKSPDVPASNTNAEKETPSKNQTHENVIQQDDQWIVRANANAHQRIQDLLHAFRLGGDVQIVLETRFVTANSDLSKFTGAKWKRINSFISKPSKISQDFGDDGFSLDASAVIEERLPVIATTMSEEQTSHFIQMAQANDRSNILFAPKITFFNGQSAYVSDSVKRPFVVGLESQDDGTTLPKIDIVDEGVHLLFKTVFDDQKGKIRLNGRFNLNEIDDVKTADVRLNGKPHTIQLPRVKKIQMKIGTNLEVGETLLMGCFPSLEKKEYLYVLVTPRMLIDSTTMKPLIP